MPDLIVAALVRNEEKRFWREILASWSAFADRIVVVDNDSTDETRALAIAAGADVYEHFGPMWGAEALPRAKLFNIAWDSAKEGDYILVLDGDMTPLRDPRPLMETRVDCVNFALYDLWSEEPLAYRSDAFWRAHLTPRPWMIRKRNEAKPREGWEWPSRGIHVGHFPRNLSFETFAYAPADMSLLHYGYIREDLRDEKYIAYASVAAELSDFERRHAISIRDAEPRLERLPFTPTWSIV